MRFLAAAVLSLLPVAAGATAVDLQMADNSQFAKKAGPAASRICERTTRSFAYQQGAPLKPRKLTELPPAKGFMAVYRVVNGCEDPMTMIEYGSRGRR